MTINEIFMHRCLDLARLGAGVTAPNPMVGSVVVHEGKIIGEGFHQRFGEAHAEVNAINSVKNESLLQISTLYVNLEPCAHYGKTPPCAKLIIEKKIPKVVIGTVDPFAKVAGKGIQMLRNAGVDVVVGILSEECNQLNRRFFTFYQKKRPYVILKWAQTQDGYIDIFREPESYGHSVWITNYLSKVSVHRLRTEETAIMVGTNTAEKDNPALTAREWSGRSPLRVVLDRDLRLRKTLKIFDDSVHTLVFTNRYLTGKKNLEYVHIDYDGKVIQQILDELYQRNIQSLIVEGGRKLLDSFILQNHWDEAQIYIGNKFFGNGVKAPSLPGSPQEEDTFDESRLYVFYNR